MRKLFFLTVAWLLSLTMTQAAVDFGTEPTVSTATTWTFEDFTDAITAHTLVKTSGYLRAYARTQNDRQFSFENATGSVTFDTEVAYTKVAKASAKMVGVSSGYTTAATAGMASPSVALPAFAFNAAVPGTVYVAMKSAGTEANGQRIYFNDGTTASVVKQHTATGEIDVFSYTSEAAGAFFIGDVKAAYDLYAVRFVPTATEPDPTPGPTPSETVSVFLTAGQSNTAGRCMNDNLPDYIKTLGTNNSGAYQYCNWSYTNGSTRKEESEGVFRKFWPEMESAGNSGRFAFDAIVYYWIEQALQKDFYVVKHAQGGTSIDPTCTSTNDYHWSADATWLAEHASCNTDGGTSMLKAFCDNIGKSIEALADAGKTADVKAMIWHQGESDRTGTGPDNYHDNLKAVVKYVRDYLVTKTGDEKYATLDFICGTVPKESKQYNKKIYDALFTLAQEDSHFHVIETAPGTFIGDQLHFDTNCAERLGINMYNKMVDLGLVSGEKQTVPEPNVPEATTVTLDFATWTNENLADATTYANLISEESSSLTAIDGTTPMYKILGSDADGDFSEFAETFALGTPANVQLRGGKNGLIANKKQSILSLLNLEPGDAVTITTKAGDGKNSLVFVSTNAYKMDDATKTAVTTETEWVSGETYVITEGTQLDLLFGKSNTSNYIYKVVIEKGAVEIPGETPGGDPVVDPTDEPTTAVTIHTIGDSTMSHYDQSIAAQKGMDGWGDYLGDCMKGEWTTVKNWADRGETAKSYFNGYWNGTKPDERPDFTQEINKEVNAGDYVIIQFGHNDSKAYDTATYEEWLGKLVNAVKEKGATPILSGSICRARFDSNGKITRLGRIDTGEENGVGEGDHTYDYPYHAQQVAIAKNIEFIDITTGVKEMFETYGEAKTKALFPSGEKTHTNKLGAQLIAKVAAKLLLGTALKNYVDATKLELPSADDIDVIIDDFKEEAIVTKKTIWTFNDVEAGAVLADDAKAVVNQNGLYLRGGATSRAINAVVSELTGITFSDGTMQSVTTAAQTAGANTAAESTVGQNTAGRQAANALAPMFALNIGTPGTFYAVMAPTKKATDRNINLFFSGKLVESKVVNDVYDTENHLCELKYHAASTGVIYIAAGVASNLYAAMFVPDMEAGTEEDWNYQMVMTREDGYWTYCNRMPENQQVPQGLTAYAVSSIDAEGKAVLTDIGSVITPGMGVIVKGEPNTEYPMASTTAEATYTGENLLVGNTTLQYLPAKAGDKTNYYYENATTGFVKATGGETIHEKQAYLSVEATAETIAIVIAESQGGGDQPGGGDEPGGDDQPDDDDPGDDDNNGDTIPNVGPMSGVYYISTDGRDTNDGKTPQTAFATLAAAQQCVQPGNIVYILPGTYQITEDQISYEDATYKAVFNMNQKGEKGKPISFVGLTVNGERPVFDLSQVNPAGFRVTAFLVTGSYLVFRNFEVVGIQVNITEHTQSENFRINSGKYNTFDNIACHDGMGIGFYLHNNSHHNLILNCDGYNNYDPVSEKGMGGQNDAFGCHVKAGNDGNLFIGCRAWNNSDDGYDLINCYSPVTFCYSIAYKNGYDAEGKSRQDGNGFKAGGYGMGSEVSLPATGAPRHEVYHCIASNNKANGIYSNHHLGGVYFHHNTAYENAKESTASNYSLVNRKGTSKQDAVDVSGYGHQIEYNLSCQSNGKHVSAMNGGDGQNTITGNSFVWDATTTSWMNTDMPATNFVSTKLSRLLRKRQTNGMLNTLTTTYLQQRDYAGYGCDFSGYKAAVEAAKRITGAETGGQSTAIHVVTHATLQQDTAIVYDLQGRRIASPKQGLYIVNGRKYIKL